MPTPSYTIPTEIIRQILKYAYPSTLSICMRVSKTFYEVAGPLLYSNVIVKYRQPMSRVLVGFKTPDKNATRCRPAVSNLKVQLLSYVQQLTVATHSCDAYNLPIDSSAYRNLFPTELFLNLKTLLVIPFAECCETEYLCDYSNRCPILARARPRKVVLHNSRMHRNWPEDWRKCCHPIATYCPTLTMVLDETACDMVNFDKRFGAGYVAGLKELRIIACKTPKWVDKIAQRVTCSDGIANIESLANGIIAPVVAEFVADKSIAITIYLFRRLDLEEDTLKRFNRALHEGILYARQKAGAVWDSRDGPSITIKTLSDYIDEGLEDEFLWQELQYWRNENQKRMTEVEGEDVSEIDEMVLGMFVGLSSYSSADLSASRSSRPQVAAPLP